MGMFDEVKYNAPFPDDRVKPGMWFQTKSLGCGLLHYTINEQGRLIYNRHHYEEDTGHEIREGGVILPTFNLIKVEDIDTEYHGDIRLYGTAKEDAWLDYVARFTHGTLEWSRPFEELSETNWSLTRDY